MLLLCLPAMVFADDVIGSEARKRAMEEGVISGASPIESLGSTLKLLIGLVTVMVFTTLALVLKVSNFQFMRTTKSNPLNGGLMMVFFTLLMGGIAFNYYVDGHKLHIPAASEHAPTIDSMFRITAAITFFVFLVTQTLLFYFSWRYQKREGQTALYYPDNHKLEQLWTIIPAVVMSGLVIWGAVEWFAIKGQVNDTTAINVELVAEQFQWTVRHSGPDNKLAGYSHKKIIGANNLGINLDDKAALDDIVFGVKEIHLPVNKMVKFNIRSKDVLHGFYTPHFKAHIYAVPGMPTQFAFKPTVTTKQMRAGLKNEKFDYEVLCSQLCGSAHYNMRFVIIVETEEEYKTWLASQKPTFTAEKIEQMKAEEKAAASTDKKQISQL